MLACKLQYMVCASGVARPLVGTKIPRKAPVEAKRRPASNTKPLASHHHTKAGLTDDSHGSRHQSCYQVTEF